MEKIKFVINFVKENSESRPIDVYPPVKWHLMTFPDFDSIAVSVFFQGQIMNREPATKPLKIPTV